MAKLHPSDSSVQLAAEALILELLGQSIGADLSQGSRIEIGSSHVQPDGISADGSVSSRSSLTSASCGVVSAQVSTDALKLLTIREVFPHARLILAFADEEATASVSGWKAEVLKANGIEIRV